MLSKLIYEIEYIFFSNELAKFFQWSLQHKTMYSYMRSEPDAKTSLSAKQGKSPYHQADSITSAMAFPPFNILSSTRSTNLMLLCQQ